MHRILALYFLTLYSLSAVFLSSFLEYSEPFAASNMSLFSLSSSTLPWENVALAFPIKVDDLSSILSFFESSRHSTVFYISVWVICLGGMALVAASFCVAIFEWSITISPALSRIVGNWNYSYICMAISYYLCTRARWTDCYGVRISGVAAMP